MYCYAECHFAESHCVECRGAQFCSIISSSLYSTTFWELNALIGPPKTPIWEIGFINKLLKGQPAKMALKMLWSLHIDSHVGREEKANKM